MSRKLSSPTAQLLRASRLFSLPPPLPRPDNYGTSSEMSSDSETATQAYPTHQAIATPTSSLCRGDWGLKRPLPLRETTRSSTPTMRVHEVDTINLFTDFESAGDHVQTLQKWQEMNIPLSIKVERVNVSDTSGPEISVFEEKADNTELSSEQQKQGFSKWKYQGPWISGMNQGEFQSFLETGVRERKQEFRDYLRKHITQEAFAKASESARDTGSALPKVESFSISEAEFEDKLKQLREDTTLSSELTRLIRDFFDLPGVYGGPAKDVHAEFVSVAEVSSTDSGPPATHPSAGLSYLRSSAFLHNHPVLGPRAERQPVEARVLGAKSTIDNRSRARLGLGGVVTEFNHANSSRRGDISMMTFDDEGGPKMWMSPSRAHIDAQGRIKLSVKQANEEDVQIKKGSLTRSEAEARSKPMPDVQPFGLNETLDSGSGYGPDASKNNEELFRMLRNSAPAEAKVQAPRRGIF
ncbi:uncharacterized protein K452DRAFT_291104 [Aplosporella prunicola CBS 121167]|uniref:Mitochondrial ribosomal protein MRP51 n=1 Tax=Aplosporella prunicola CBS 121167 TaxID=1176127 RepID=A0A6A6B4C4_9PEZI|nr:uncharacterized protein K452DRAFT_291104 [Aplosporella prunicola CBS 121167]KAF2138064.1 hypothetical protein K452DRAFT_291104 [Aplosporella prunicola CBS 121167]